MARKTDNSKDPTKYAADAGPQPQMPGLRFVENPSAPMIYFDCADIFGIRNGVFNITLEALQWLGGSDRQLNQAIPPSLVAAAHLRFNRSAAEHLRDVLNKLLMVADEKALSTEPAKPEHSLN